MRHTHTHKKIIKYSIMKYSAGPSTAPQRIHPDDLGPPHVGSRPSIRISPKRRYINEIGSCCIHGYTFCGFSLQETAKVRRWWDEKGERCTTTRETSCDVLSSFRWNRKAQSWYPVHPMVSETVWGSKGSGWRAQQGDRESPNVWLLCKSNNE